MHKFTVTQNGNKGNIKIIGNISEWRNSSKDFNSSLEGLKEAGVKDVEIYINSYGGSVFEANEIANLIQSFDGKIVFVLGAVCASAATLIVNQVYTQKAGVLIKQYKNGQYMIHNVSGVLQGQIKDIESGLQLMRNLQQNAIDNYALQTGMTSEAITQMMDKETWLTAKQALEQKFITEIIDQSDNQAQNLSEILNLGYSNIPDAIKNFANQHNSHNINNNKKAMDLNQINNSLGKDFKNEAEAIGHFVSLEAENKRLKTENEAAVEMARAEKVENILQTAVKENKILAGQKETYRKLLNDSFEATKGLIENMKPTVPISGKIKTEGNGITQQSDKSYKELAESTPSVLTEMFENDFAQFNKLFKAEYGVDYLK